MLLIQKERVHHPFFLISAAGRNRTDMGLPPRDFKSLVYTSSTTAAYDYIVPLQINYMLKRRCKQMQSYLATNIKLGKCPLGELLSSELCSLERETGFAPATSSLARKRSTTELLPQIRYTSLKPTAQEMHLRTRDLSPSATVLLLSAKDLRS